MSRAVAVAKNSAVAEVSRPSVPREIAKLIADPYTLDGMPEPGAWRVPDVIPDRKMLESVADSLRKHMTGADPEWIKSCLTRLAALTHIEGHADLTPHQKQQYWKASAEEYIRLLGRFPADIWVRCTDEAILKKPFFPKPAELFALMQPQLDRRIQAVWRIEQMLKKPAAEPERPKEKLPDRLRAIIDTWKKLPAGAIKDCLARSAFNAEADLAALENRAVEDWAKPEVAA